MNEIHQGILKRTEKLVREERRITTEVLECLQEIESKMIYAELAYSSLYEFCIKHLKYSEGSAHRRISAMRLLKSLPTNIQIETKEKIESGELTVSNISVVHGFLKTEKKEAGKTYSQDEKASLLHSIENQSKNALEKRLSAIQPKLIPQESKRILTPFLTEIKFVADENLMIKLNRIHEISGHTMPGAGLAETFAKLADEYLQKHDPMIKLKLRKVRIEKQKKKRDALSLVANQ